MGFLFSVTVSIFNVSSACERTREANVANVKLGEQTETLTARCDKYQSFICKDAQAMFFFYNHGVYVAV